MKRRSAFLGAAVAVLLVADGLWIYERYFRLNAMITYFGLDSIAMEVPASAHAAQLRDGKWDTDPMETLRSRVYEPSPGYPQRMAVAYVSLGTKSQFGQAIAIFRDLKSRNICHAAVREGATKTAIKIDFGRGPEESLDVPSVVLCGDGYGDAAFFGTLPADRLIHVESGMPSVR